MSIQSSATHLEPPPLRAAEFGNIEEVPASLFRIGDDEDDNDDEVEAATIYNDDPPQTQHSDGVIPLPPTGLSSRARLILYLQLLLLVMGFASSMAPILILVAVPCAIMSVTLYWTLWCQVFCRRYHIPVDDMRAVDIWLVRGMGALYLLTTLIMVSFMDLW